MRRIAVLAIVLLATGIVAFAQSAAGEPDPSRIGADSAQQMLKEVSVTRFEDAAFFYPAISADTGLVAARKFVGGPMDKVAIEDEEAIGIPQVDDNVLGIRVDFFRRGAHSMVVAPVKPIPIEGIAKVLSLWVVGRNYNHVLKIMITDYFGAEKELVVGRLNFTGWKKLTVAVPPGIQQDEYHYAGRSGIQFTGLKIEFDLMETYGQYYVYFDDLRAWTDLFSELSRDDDNMTDGW